MSDDELLTSSQQSTVTSTCLGEGFAMSGHIFFEVQSPGCCKITKSSDDSLPAPTIFTGRPLRGTLRISHVERQEHVFDVVQLTLQGEVHVRLPSGIYCECEIKKPLILMSCVKVANEFQRIDLGNPHTLTYQTRFFFDIPDSTTLPSSYGNGTSQRLPPSMRVVKSDFISAATEEIHNGGSLAGTCDVTYRIVARFFAGGRQKCDASREIILMPVEDIPPPIDPEDFGEEYRLVAAASLRLSWRSRKSVTVVISSMEPRPLTCPNCKGGCESTEVLLQLKTGGLLDGSSERVFVDAQLIDCEVQINLEAVTYFSGHEQAAVMSMVEALQSPFVVLKKASRVFRMGNNGLGDCHSPVELLLPPFILHYVSSEKICADKTSDSAADSASYGWEAPRSLSGRNAMAHILDYVMPSAEVTRQLSTVDLQLEAESPLVGGDSKRTSSIPKPSLTRKTNGTSGWSITLIPCSADSRAEPTPLRISSFGLSRHPGRG
ncbi:hypothetical protein V501_01097 [Pseudogymnoascus sp. VKM F-4519 (FW-2642)]|nr:hypothetical protein V501_01097 [Pseudogymnoascus sp. VKM F-4519 (FW-2642)]